MNTGLAELDLPKALKIRLAKKSSIPFRCRAATASVGDLTMAETCEITLKIFPSRKMRKQVKNFMKGEDVTVKDISGQIYSVELKRNRLVLTPEDTMVVQEISGECTTIEYLIK